MTYKEYEEKAITTKCYADEVAIPYVVLGLCGELGETLEKLGQEASRDEIIKEIGDQMWYLAGIRVELNLNIEDDWDWTESEKLTPFNLTSEVGKIAEQVKKWLRDDWKVGQDNVFPEKRKSAVVEAWKNIWMYLNDLCIQLESSIEEVGRINNEKLASRKQRDVIHGSGDNR